MRAKAQACRQIELIIVNDGLSTLATAPRPTDEIWIDQPQNSRVRFDFPCRGQVKNIGLARATGELVAFLDDEWRPGKLAAQVAAMHTTGCRMCATTRRRVRGGLIPQNDDSDPGGWAAEKKKLALADLERRGFVTYRRDDQVVGLLSRGQTVELCFSGRRPLTNKHTKVQEAFFPNGDKLISSAGATRCRRTWRVI